MIDGVFWFCLGFTSGMVFYNWVLKRFVGIDAERQYRQWLWGGLHNVMVKAWHKVSGVQKAQ